MEPCALEPCPLELINTLVEMMGEELWWLRWPRLTRNGEVHPM
jgi:hypothetical protein